MGRMGEMEGEGEGEGGRDQERGGADGRENEVGMDDEGVWE